MLHKPIPPILLLIAIVAMVALDRANLIGEWIPFPWSLFGIAPIVSGVGLAIWSAALFRRGGTTIRPGFESNTLVTGGPFRISRNPIYLGMVFTLIGIATLMGNVTPLLVVPVFAATIQLMFIRMEERMLHEVFGDRYTAYKRRVHTWL
jgi:protein-S-isoprenylcysteine O-methyltransferase Ste14